MKKHTSQEAYYERLRNLGNVNKTSVKESLTRTLGNLIDYKRAADGVAYGIIKENHNYYIKKAGTKQDPNVSDFAYIGGLENITSYQYTSLSEADKQRNMMFHTINEAVGLKPNKTGSKMVLTEDVAGKEIAAASEKIGDLDAAASAEETPEIEEPSTEELPTETGEEVPAEEPETSEVPEEKPELETGEENPEGEESTEEVPADAGVEVDEPNKEIEKSVGKLTDKIRKTKMTDSQVKSYVNSFLASFKDKFPEIEIEDRKAMANKILKVVGQEDINDLESSMPAEEVEESKELCAECGGFTQYAESRGYTKESIAECGDEEMGNLVSGYANAHNDGMNDGDLETVAIFITPEIIDSLKNDYGHDEYAEKLTPYTQSMNEASYEDKLDKINELNWGGVGNVGKMLGNKIGGAVKGAAQGISNAVSSKVNSVTSGLQQLGTEITQNYQKGVKDTAVKELEKLAAELGQTLNKLNIAATKAGEQPININSILTTIKNQVGSKGTADLSKFKSAVAEAGMVDAANVEVQPNMIKEDEEEIETSEETPESGFAPDAQNLGVNTIEPTSTTGVDINVDAQNKVVNIAMNENEDKPSSGSTKEKKGDVAKTSTASKTSTKTSTKAYTQGNVTVTGGAGDGATNVTISPSEDQNEVDENMDESETRVRKYIRARLEEKVNGKKSVINESTKSKTLKKLDEIIDKQFKQYENVAKSKKSEKINEVFGFSVKEKFSKLDPNNAAEVDKLFNSAFNTILINPQMGIIGRAAKTTPINVKYDILKKYVELGGGTLRLAPDNKTVTYAPQSLKDKTTKSNFGAGGTNGSFGLGGV